MLFKGFPSNVNTCVACLPRQVSITDFAIHWVETSATACSCTLIKKGGDGCTNRGQHSSDDQQARPHHTAIYIVLLPARVRRWT